MVSPDDHLKINASEKAYGAEDRKRHEPVSNKDFKSMMEKDSGKGVAKLKRHAKGSDEESADLEELKGATDEEAKGKLSLFDLSGEKESKKRTAPLEEMAQKDSPEALMKQAAERKQEKSKQAAGSFVVGQEAKPREDLLSPTSSMNALAGAAVTQSKAEQPASPQLSPIQKVVDSLINKLYTMEAKGQTDTVLSLNNPPMFRGASIVVTSYESAKGEFNIAFENLTQAAKQFLDFSGNLDQLRMGLEQKGYVAHIIVTTTETERSQVASSEEPRESRQDPSKEDSEQDQPEEEGH